MEREHSLEIPGLVLLKETSFFYLQTVKKIQLRNTLSKPIKTQFSKKKKKNSALRPGSHQGFGHPTFVKTSEQIKVVPVNPFSWTKWLRV